MENRKYISLLADVILLPFTRIEFVENDLIQNYAIAYRNLVDPNKHSALNSELIKSFDESKKSLKEFFLKDNRWNHLDDAARLLNMFFPGDKIMRFITEGDIGRFYIKYIFDIAKSFITFRDGIVSIRNWSKEHDALLSNYNEFEKVELWHHISRTAVSDLFIAALYVDYEIDAEEMYNVPNLVYLADMPLRIILNKGVAETHLHAKAGISYQALWESYTSLDEYFWTQKTAEIWFCTFFRIYSAAYMESDTSESFENFIFKENDFICNWFKAYIRKETNAVPDINVDFKEYIHDFWNRFSNVQLDEHDSLSKKSNRKGGLFLINMV